jgi:hypothetical protein
VKRLFRFITAFGLSLLVLLHPPAARAADAELPSVAVLETYALDMSAAASAVTRQLYATAARLGYRTVPESETTRLTVLRGPHLLAPADLLAIAHDAGVELALQATLTASGERYVASLLLVSRAGPGPVLVRADADAATLEAAVDRLARSVLPPVPVLPAGPPEPTAPKPNVRLAIQTEGAFGLSENFFYNHFAGARLDYGFTRDFALGAYVGYANLKGREGRAQNVLSYLQLEYRWSVSRGGQVLLPLRFGAGYLPKNGPLLRLAAGPSFSLGGTARLGFDLLAPTFVIVHDRTVVSMDVAAEVSFEL